MKVFEQGFTVLPSILTHNDCVIAREKISLLPYLSDGVGVSVFDAVQVDLSAKLIFHPALTSLYREILGKDISLLPNITWRRNTSSPWHIDEAFRQTHADIGQEKTSFLQCTVYLQANDQDGGGLDVIPRSHLPNYSSSSTTAAELARWLTTQAITVQSNDGDAVIWDGRLLHKSSLRGEAVRTNYATHWTIANSHADLGRVFKHMLNRAANGGDIANIDRRYDVMKRFRFSDHAPVEFLAAAEKADIQLFDMSLYELNGSQ